MSVSTRLTHFTFQVIIFGSWIFSLIFHFPRFLYSEFDKDIDRIFCVKVWPDWITKAYYWTWLFLIVISGTLMIGSYSRVVYTLWFKGNEDNELSHRQQVWVNWELLTFGQFMYLRSRPLYQNGKCRMFSHSLVIHKEKTKEIATVTKRRFVYGGHISLNCLTKNISQVKKLSIRFWAKCRKNYSVFLNSRFFRSLQS